MGIKERPFRGESRPCLEEHEAIPAELWAKPGGPEPSRRAEMIQSLAEMHPGNLFSLVHPYIEDERSEVRLQALHAAAISGDQKALPVIRGASTDPSRMIQKEAPTLMKIFFVSNPDPFKTGWTWYLLAGFVSGLIGLLFYVAFLMGTYYGDHSLVICYAVITVLGVGVIHELTKRFRFLFQGMAHLAGGVILGWFFVWVFFGFHPHYSSHTEVYPLFMGSIAQLGLLFAASRVFMRRAMPAARILIPAAIAGFGGLLAVVIAKNPFGPNNFLYCFLNTLALCLLSERYTLAPNIFMRHARFWE